MVSGGGPLFRAGGVAEEQTVARLASWIKLHSQEKFMATYMTLSPHHPYDYPSEDEVYAGGSWLDRYRNSLHFADRAVGQLIEFLRSEHLLEKTLVVVYGDHGETVSTYPVGHGLNASGEELFTPFIISNPALFPQPLVSHVPSNHLDIAPVIVSALGINAPMEWLGRDLLADHIIARPQFTTIFHVHKLGIRDGNLLYVWDEAKNSSEMFELNGYDVQPLAASDPRRNLIGAYCAKAELFEDWNLQHHVKRALDLQRAAAPPELMHDITVTSSTAAPSSGD
jgi:arylsulfatase A-like enzyme